MQVERLIEALEVKYKISIEQFLELYQSNFSREEIAEEMACGEWCIRAVGSALNLRMAKKYRINDYSMYLSRFAESSESLVTAELQEALEDLNLSYRDNVKLERQLLQTRRDLQKYKSVIKTPELPKVNPELPQLVINTNLSIRNPSDKYKDHVQMIVLSDNHVEELVSRTDVGLANEYNWEIMESRLAKVFAESIDNYRGESKCIVASLGDQFSGIIHDTLEHTGKSLGEAINDYSYLLTSYIQTIASIYDEVYVPILFGNHGRLSQNKKSAHYGTDNVEYMMAQIIKALLIPTKNIKVDISTTGLLAFKVGDRYVGCHHGDYFLKATGDIKFLRIKEHFKQVLGIEPDVIIQGHTHVFCVEQMPRGGTYITNGSLIGANGYSVTNGMVGKDWGQVILSFLPSGVVENIRLV